jgi:rSAM/selenodomain-associated transferase 1
MTGMEPRAGHPTVVVMAKAPVAGSVKTRLVPALSLAEAADLYHCFFLDTVELVREVPAARVLAYAPADARPWFGALCPDFELLPQTVGDLGARMAAVFDTLFARRAGPVVLIGADAPTLPAHHITRALAALARGATDAVLGPAEDGGYCLVGLAAPQPALFADVPWGTAEALARTLEHAAARTLRVVTLPSWWDVDTPDDLRRLATAAPDEGGPARHTRRYLAARAAAGRTI